MKPSTKYWTRKAHRWISLLIGIQLLLWTVSGLYFSLVPIETVRGEDNISEQPPENFSHTPLISPQIAIASLRERSGPSLQVRALQLRRVLEVPVYEIRYDLGGEHLMLLADAQNGELRPPISREQAIEIAQLDFAPMAAVSSVEFIEQVAAGEEYRGGPLPAWRVNFDDSDNSRLYVSADLARVTARRNSTWRIYDFLWMLHIMDFENRKDFNTLLLKILAVLGVVTIVSGFILWGMTTSLFRSNEKQE
jgi:uncharacterized iron-regulated membrane protein